MIESFFRHKKQKKPGFQDFVKGTGDKRPYHFGDKNDCSITSFSVWFVLSDTYNKVERSCNAD